MLASGVPTTAVGGVFHEVRGQQRLYDLKEAQASGIIDTDAGDTVYTLTLKLSDGGSHEVKLCEYLKGFNALYYGSGPSLYIKADALKPLIEAK